MPQSATAFDRLIEAAGATCSTCRPTAPTSIPSKCFSKLKALLREVAARTVDGLWRAIADALRRFTPKECANYFDAAGYDAV